MIFSEQKAILQGWQRQWRLASHSNKQGH